MPMPLHPSSIQFNVHANALPPSSHHADMHGLRLPRLPTLNTFHDVCIRCSRPLSQLLPPLVAIAPAPCCLASALLPPPPHPRSTHVVM
eukprot:144301-Chlamydomonas_euryale.AAC.2